MTAPSKRDLDRRLSALEAEKHQEVSVLTILADEMAVRREQCDCGRAPAAKCLPSCASRETRGSDQ